MKTTAKTPARRRQSHHLWRVLIVNGMTPVREEIAKWINRSPDLRVCGEALGEKTGLEMIRRLRPGLVLTEILHPQDLGFIRELHRHHRRLPILAYSFRDEEAYAARALAAGARGYLMKNVNGRVLLAGIHKVLKGRTALSPVMAARLRRKVCFR